jgi:hypothetical protein
MAGEFSTAGSNIALDAATGRVTQTARTTYLALLSAAPNDASTLASMTEISTAGYARQAVAWTAPTGDPASTSNSGVLTFGPFSADPPNVTHCALVSALSGTTGDFIVWWALTVAKDAANGESIFFAIGALTMTLD